MKQLNEHEESRRDSCLSVLLKGNLDGRRAYAGPLTVMSQQRLATSDTPTLLEGHGRAYTPALRISEHTHLPRTYIDFSMADPIDSAL
jgi:hypothetical protein